MIRVLFVAPDAATLELVNDSCVYAPHTFSVRVNEKTALTNQVFNVFSVYGLEPGKTNEITLDFTHDSGLEAEHLFITTPGLERVDVYPVGNVDSDAKTDDTERLQAQIDGLGDSRFLYVHPGTYRVRSLFLRDHSRIELAEGALLLGSTERSDYPILRADEFHECRGMRLPLGTWEGRADDSFASVITAIGAQDFYIYGKGIVDCNAHNADWWVNHRIKRIARRPKGIFLHGCEGGVIAGLTVRNTPSWNQHPFYCHDIAYLDLQLTNPATSPTTDGCDPESCENVLIAGCRISVGDDCIAIKSGKKEFSDQFGVPSKKITIRNCLMMDGHGGVTLGSELSAGIENLTVTQCLFRNTDRGLRIKTQRGRGEKAVLENIVFSRIRMENVKVPFVVNAFYKAGNDEIDEYRFARKPVPVDVRTPRLGDFFFSDITATGAEWGAGYFLGLPELPINEIRLTNVSVSFAENAQEGAIAMTLENELFIKSGFVFENVRKAVLGNVSVSGEVGPLWQCRGIQCEVEIND